LKTLLGGTAEQRVSLFEYLAIAFSLVLSFGVMRLISGLSHALDANRRYWVHLCLVFLHLFVITTTFWIFWSYRDVEWSFPTFLLALSGPVILYFNACALIPEAPASIESWRVYYFSIRQRYFVAICAWALSAGGASTVLLSVPAGHPIRVIQTLAFAVGVLGAVSAHPRVHAGIAVVLLSVALIAAFVFISRPDALSQ
jgi:hypothetical protein